MKLLYLTLLACACTFSARAAVTTDVVYGRAGDQDLLLDVSVPDAPGPFPAVILIHGGGWTAGDKSGGPLKGYMAPMQEPLARAGYVYFSINYRLAPKYPHPAALEDVQTAIRWVKAHAADYHVDPQRLALAGESAGAQLAALAAVRADEATRVAAVVCFYGPFDLVADTEQRHMLSPNLKALIGRDTLDDETRRQLAAISPLNFVKSGLPPFLLLHGTADATVAFSQSTEMLARLQSANVKSQLIPIEGGGHGMLPWAGFRPAFKAEVVAWLNATLPAHDVQLINMGRSPPKYPLPYAPASVAEITAVLTRIHGYLEIASPMKLIDAKTHAEITDFSQPHPGAILARGDFQLVSYEWGVTYAGMLLAGETTGDPRFTDFTARRLKFLAALAPLFRDLATSAETRATPPGPGQPPLRQLLAPRALDDCGAMTAAMLKARRAGLGGDLQPLIATGIDFLSNGQFRFSDGTLARNRPLADTLWLDDLFMSVPALAQMGKLTGEARYYDDAVRQILQFSDRMFVPEHHLFMHGWVKGMDTHPAFYWARANGWALMAMAELLDVLPEAHPQRARILALFRDHARGIARCQSGDGLWHQLLDRSDSYPETSASAIFVYSLARGVNRGWLDAHAYGPMLSLAWNAVAQKVNAQGQVEGTCVGTGMGFDPAFYYYRPTSVYAAHGYGPVLLAGAEMVTFRKNKGSEALVSDGAVQLHGVPKLTHD